VALAAARIARPVILAADDLQLFDEVSLEILIDLVRFLSDRPAGERPPWVSRSDTGRKAPGFPSFAS
jgi:hypothetical protein